MSNGSTNQGLNEDANRFAYRARIMQQEVLRRQKKFGPYLFWSTIHLVAGYGYSVWRIFFVYAFVIVVFAAIYYFYGQKVGSTLNPVEAWVFSMISFHGRGIFPGTMKLDNPLAIVAAFEAFVGLVIEVIFIATLTRRLFAQ